jgi:NAD(P)H-hydrate epimerase
MAEPIEPQDNGHALPQVPERQQDAHKGDFGLVLIVATSPGMSGAGVLVARASLRAGAGLATLAVPAPQQPIVAAQLTSVMSAALPATSHGVLGPTAAPVVLALAERARCALAVGPGLGRSPETGQFLAALLPAVARPLVLDADALMLLANQPGVLQQRPAPTVVTPHVGEMAALCGVTVAELQADRLGWAQRWAAQEQVIVVLKGHGTLISDGCRTYRNGTGNPGMATAGSGDVLTGIIAALMAQGIAPLDAARLGVYVHGAAGDHAAREVGQLSLVADDLIAALPRAFQELAR